MNHTKIKSLITTLFVFGLGFALSCFIGIDGVREQLQTNQLIIGGIICILASVLYLVVFRLNHNKDKHTN